MIAPRAVVVAASFVVLTLALRFGSARPVATLARPAPGPMASDRPVAERPPVLGKTGGEPSIEAELSLETDTGSKRSPDLLEVLRRGTWGEKQRAVDSLHGTSDNELLKVAIPELLAAPEMFLRLRAVAILRERRLKEWIPSLLDLAVAGPESPMLREEAGAALLDVAEIEFTEELRHRFAGADLQGQRLIGLVLANLGDNACLEDFVRRASLGLAETGVGSESHRIRCIWELSRLPLESVKPTMIGALTHTQGDVRMAAIRWLGENGAGDDLAILQAQSASPASAHRKVAEEALLRLRERMARGGK